MHALYVLYSFLLFSHISNGFTVDDRRRLQHAVHAHVLSSIRVILQAMVKLRIPLVDSRYMCMCTCMYVHYTHIYIICIMYDVYVYVYL